MNEKLVYGIKKIIYGTSENHKILSTNKQIGDNGENLTIMFLSYNRVQSSFNLLNSIKKYIPNFMGKILIIDNKSDIKELNELKKFIKKLKYDINIIELDKNYGVAAGRNKGIENVETDWIFSLDNDIYLIDNPIPYINDAIKILGCHFLNVPLLDDKKEKYFLNGGHLYIDLDEYLNIFIGGGSLFKQCNINEFEDEMSFSTFFAGGTSVFRKDTFLKMGKFDEGYFIGFEDIDFSIRLFQEGYKIGTCTGKSLVHNHVISNDNNSISYEKNRFSTTTIYDSAMYFEKKWGLKVWNKNTAMWLEQRQKELKIHNQKEIEIVKNSLKIKPRIALVVDVYNWCFYNISKQIEKNLSNYYDIEIIVMDNFNTIYEVLFYLKKFDLVHFFWRGHLLWITPNDNEYLKSKYLIDFDEFKNKIIDSINISTSVYDHLYLNEEIENTKKILSYTKNYTVSSNILFDIYNKIDDIPKPKKVITDGVDLSLFYPENNKYDSISNRKIIFGWVGNSLWNEKDEDFKGFNTIIKPVLNELISEGYPIQCYFADKQERQIPFEKMNEYYNNIDVLLCASKSEGTPNPVLEAMATGTVVISTNVGVVPDAMGKKQKEYILKERSKENLKENILKLLSEKNYKEISEENIKSIKSWDWKNITKKFKLYFDECLKEGKNTDEETKKQKN